MGSGTEQVKARHEAPSSLRGPCYPPASFNKCDVQPDPMLPLTASISCEKASVVERKARATQFVSNGQV